MATAGGVNQNALVAGQLIYSAFYAGDQWQVTPRLTLNYGVRFEQMGPWSERYDRLTVLLPTRRRLFSGLNLRGKDRAGQLTRQ